jgi:antitoxin component YwqK of YwqJK toxin-antitoxin module
MNQYSAKGLKDGPWKIFYQDVLLSKGSYVNNSREGLWTKYWTTGGLCWTAYYKNDEPIGYVVNYNRQPINIIFTTSFLL